MPVLSSTLALMRAVAIVSVPEASVTQNGVAAHTALTDSEVLSGIAEALVYSTRMMSSLQTSTRIFPPVSVKVTPCVSTA